MSSDGKSPTNTPVTGRTEEAGKTAEQQRQVDYAQQIIEAKILSIKQLEEDPFNNYLAANKKGAIVTGTVTEVDAKGAKVELAESVEGYVRAADISRERVEDASTELSVGDSIEARFMGVDRKNRTLSLSIKAKDEAEEKEAVESVNKQQDSSGINSAMADAFKAAKTDD